MGNANPLLRWIPASAGMTMHTGFRGPALDPDPGFAGMTSARPDATNGLRADG